MEPFREKKPWLALVAGVICAFSSTTWAFTFETAVTRGCHEEMTWHALTENSAAWQEARSPRTSDDEALASQLPFEVPKAASRFDMAMMVGVRDNDTQGHAMSDLPELAAVHNGSHNQDAHCLRAPDQKFEEGNRAALLSCRAYIHREIEWATNGDLTPDVTQEEVIPLELRFQSARVPLSRFSFHMGRALHALQDSFAHSLRNAENIRVVSVLNYVDFALSSGFSEERDGHAHLSALDACEGTTEFDQKRIDAARRLSAGLVKAVAEPAASREERLTKIDAVLDEALAYEPGCHSGNDWCGTLASIQALSLTPSGCSATHSDFSFASLLGLLWLARRRRHSS